MTVVALVFNLGAAVRVTAQTHLTERSDGQSRPAWAAVRHRVRVRHIAPLTALRVVDARRWQRTRHLPTATRPSTPYFDCFTLKKLLDLTVSP